MKRISRCIAILVLAVQTTHACADEPFKLVQGDIVAFLGGTNVVNMQNAGYLEAFLTAAYPDARLKFRDIAWEGDTVYRQGTVVERWRKDKFGGLREQLDANKVTVVFAQFGQSEAIKGLEKLDDFVKAYDQLLSICRQDGRRVVVMSPISFERTNEPLPDLSARNSDLGEFVSAIEQLAVDHKYVFVDLFSFWNRKNTKFTTNGLHVSPASQRTVANAIVNRLALPSVGDTSLSPLRTEVVNKHQLWMNYWRPANWKCLYGDDGKREFGKATAGGLTLREEWKQLPGLMAESEERIWRLAKELKGGHR